MELGFLHVGLAFGAALAAIPVILHLILRERPRHELFPALRLIRLRHRANLRKLRIRHWLLLVMRMLLIALLALALARPRVHGAKVGLDERAPVAAALIFDTSLSMEYRFQDRTRLAEAQQIATQFVKELPESSEVLVLDSADPALGVLGDVSTALRRIEAMRLRPRSRTLNAALVEACGKLAESSLTRREIYLFTDLTTGCFDGDGATQIAAAVKAVPGGAAIYLVNAGREQTENVAVTDATPTADVVPANSTLLVRTRVLDAGQGVPVRVELHIDGQLRGEQELPLAKNDAARHEFTVRGLANGFHQGLVRVRGGGGLAFDDVRYFTVAVNAPTRVLAVSDQERDARSWMLALAPDELVQQQRARYVTTWVSTDRLAGTKLSDYSVVALLNVSSVPASAWRAIEDFVRTGGGLGVFPGDRVERENYNQAPAQAVLPARLVGVVAPEKPTFMKAVVPSHPAIRTLYEWDKAALGRAIIERYWKAAPPENDSHPILAYADDTPALLERLLTGPQPGRVLLLTTAVNPPPRTRPWDEWNNLQQTESAATFVILADGITQFLAGQVDQRLNWQAGEDVVLRPERDQRLGAYLVYAPDNPEPTRGSVDAAETAILVPAPEAVGHYRVEVGQSPQSFQRQFSVNASPDESRLEPMSTGELNTIFGEGKFAVATSLDELQRVMGDVRIGRELFPWLIALLLLVLAAEPFLANRFYAENRPTEPARRARI
jgi:hypothetical protein